MKDELIVNGTILDLSDEFAIPVDFSIADIKDLSKRSRNKTKEIVLPDTPINRAFFVGNYEMTSTEGGITFDPTQKQPTMYNKGGVTILRGMMQLKKIVQIDGVLKFHVGVYSDIADIFLAWQNTKISELNWSAYNHTLNKTNVSATWTATAGTGIYYPLIERGLARLAPDKFRTTDLVPYLYVYEILVKAFALVGMTISSTYLNSTDFKNMLFGYGGGELQTLNATQLAFRRVTLNNGTIFYNPTPINYYSPLTDFQYMPVTFLTSTEVTDTFNQNTNGTITIARNGKYNINIGGDIGFVYQLSDVDGTIYPFTNINSGRINIFVNGNNVGAYSIQYSTVGTFTRVIAYNVQLQLQAGDILTYQIKAGGVNYQPVVGTQLYGTCLMSSSNMTFDMQSMATAITDGDYVEIPLFVPEITIADFVSGLVKHQNLYVSDPNEFGVVTIEPLSQYYLPSTQFKDISQQIDYSKSIETTPTGNTLNKTLKWKFKQSKDLEAERYLNLFESEYGDYSFDQQSYFSKGETKIDLPFSTIIPYDVAPMYPSNKVYVPRFVKQNGSGNLEPYKGNPRIMYRVPRVSGSIWFTDANGNSATVVTSLPLVHHFNSYTSPTKDLNFGLVRELYYPATIVTSANAYANFYSIFINEMVSKAGKMLNLSVKWTVADIKTLMFQKLIMIEDSLWRLNKVSDFDTNKSLTTKIELIKVLQAKAKATGSTTFENSPNLASRMYTPQPQTWTGIITQSGTSAPVIARNLNNSGNYNNGTSYDGVGVYYIDGFNDLGDRTVITRTSLNGLMRTVVITVFDETTIKIETFNTGVASNDVIPDMATDGINYTITVQNYQ